MSKTVELRDRILEQGFVECPSVVFEERYDMMDNPPPFGKYMKPVQKNGPQFDKLWRMNIGIIQQFRDVGFLYRTCFTDSTFYYLLKVYAEIELDIKEFNKVFKQTDQAVKKYYQESEFFDFYSMNIFDLMKEDFEKYREIAVERHDYYLERFIDAVPVLNDSVVDYLQEYKNVLKRVKAERAKKNQGAS